MSKSNKRPVQSARDNSPKEEKPGPLQVIADFCDTYHLPETNEIMWEWISTALSKSPSVYDTGRERSNLLFFYERLKALMEAVYAIDAQQGKTGLAGRRNTKSK